MSRAGERVRNALDDAADNVNTTPASKDTGATASAVSRGDVSGPGGRGDNTRLDE